VDNYNDIAGGRNPLERRGGNVLIGPWIPGGEKGDSLSPKDESAQKLLQRSWGGTLERHKRLETKGWGDVVVGLEKGSVTRRNHGEEGLLRSQKRRKSETSHRSSLRLACRTQKDPE